MEPTLPRASSVRLSRTLVVEPKLLLSATPSGPRVKELALSLWRQLGIEARRSRRAELTWVLLMEAAAAAR
jgi:hypothetical protein